MAFEGHSEGHLRVLPKSHWYSEACIVSSRLPSLSAISDRLMGQSSRQPSGSVRRACLKCRSQHINRQGEHKLALLAEKVEVEGYRHKFQSYFEPTWPCIGSGCLLDLRIPLHIRWYIRASHDRLLVPTQTSASSPLLRINYKPFCNSAPAARCGGRAPFLKSEIVHTKRYHLTPAASQSAA